MLLAHGFLRAIFEAFDRHKVAVDVVSTSEVSVSLTVDSNQAIPALAADLAKLADVCRWTNGYWEFGPNNQRRWNELQNTSRDIQLLTNYLLAEYKARVWSRGLPGRQDT